MKSDVLEKLFVKYYNNALLYTLSLCKSRAVAEDIVSDSFFKAFESADGGIDSFLPWLLTVCRNEYFSLCRKRKRLSAKAIDSEIADGADKVAEEIIRREEYKALYKALDKLAPPQREAVMLFYFSQLPIKSIAAVMGKSESNVKVLLYRARESLRKDLEGKI